MAALRRAIRKHVAMEKAAMDNTLDVPEEPDVEVAETPESPAPISFFTAVKLVCTDRPYPQDCTVDGQVLWLCCQEEGGIQIQGGDGCFTLSYFL